MEMVEILFYVILENSMLYIQCNTEPALPSDLIKVINDQKGQSAPSFMNYMHFLLTWFCNGNNLILMSM